jgi:hypothetical protein
MVEIGNYDGFYGEGRVFSAEEVLRLTRETRALLGDRIPLSVTVPHTLALDQQVHESILLSMVDRSCDVQISTSEPFNMPWIIHCCAGVTRY